MSRPRDASVWPEDYATTQSLRKQLCFYGQKRKLTDDAIAGACGACPVLCGYGKRWLQLYHDEQAAEKAARQAEARRTRQEKQRQTWLYIAMKPYYQKHGKEQVTCKTNSVHTVEKESIPKLHGGL